MSNGDVERLQRAAARVGRITLEKPGAVEGRAPTPEENVSLATALSRWAHELGGLPFPSYARSQIPMTRRRLHEP